ncbi:21005_t:CDS:1, partial [Gigaspora margarita]
KYNRNVGESLSKDKQEVSRTSCKENIKNKSRNQKNIRVDEWEIDSLEENHNLLRRILERLDKLEERSQGGLALNHS